jgi:N utilization substance protein B
LQVRRQARIAALQALFEIDCVRHPVPCVVQQRLEDQSLPVEGQRFVHSLVRGVLDHKDKLDEMISTYAPEWPIEQMAIIDRNILRIAIFEFLIDGGTPPKVAINEAVELAKLFGSDSSQRFVNGVLGTLMSEKSPSLGRKRRGGTLGRGG